MTPYLNIWCLQYFPLIQRRQRNRHTPLPWNHPARLYTVPRVRPGYHPGHGTTCSGYKHFTLIDEKTSIPLSVRCAYIATMTPYLNIWCLQYFPLIQRRQRNRHICIYTYIMYRSVCMYSNICIYIDIYTYTYIYTFYIYIFN